jgi:hypothetical protein
MVHIVKYYLESLQWPKVYLENALTVAEEIGDSHLKKEINFCLKKHKDKKKCQC